MKVTPRSPRFVIAKALLPPTRQISILTSEGSHVETDISLSLLATYSGPFQALPGTTRPSPVSLLELGPPIPFSLSSTLWTRSESPSCASLISAWGRLHSDPHPFPRSSHCSLPPEPFTAHRILKKNKDNTKIKEGKSDETLCTNTAAELSKFQRARAEARAGEGRGGGVVRAR